jgi:exosome complex component RRP40
VFDVSVGFAARLMMGGNAKTGGGVVVLEELGAKLEGLGGFEIAVGRNGRVWVDCSGGGGATGPAGESAGVLATVAIGRCLQETDDGGLGVTEQKKLVSRVLREMGLGK